MALTPEGKVKAKVRKLLDKFNVYHFMPATGGFGRSGVPDIVGCYHGKFFAVECKAGGNKPTALQEKQIRSIEEADGVAFVINEDNIDKLELWLSGVRLENAGK